MHQYNNDNIDNFEIGSPVFITGNVYKFKDGEYIENTDSTNCICGVKSNGNYKEFIGICVNKHNSGDTITIGDTFIKDIIMKQDTIDFATHGDFYFKEIITLVIQYFMMETY